MSLTETEILHKQIVEMSSTEFATWLEERHSEDYDAGYEDGNDRGYSNGYDDGYSEGVGE